ncbi:hypothetical protein LEP1GSC058_1550 [Leptospira fainei serovar Hurstbridge str. BUT 6]|uniref:Uncharacterized protein n=1 Tax=Leptospira fainei serovar Hurstbridge str. BUT 6 TaxID=1193011 RepID=S3VEJ5_9LEPT|nr:hypothetical protein [Leptospira fainei]EPG74915.1 hypothetical protein LEP1GSC058_1550 [Leptospira fainei serovar Hurstbridge str. BUT 6]
MGKGYHSRSPEEFREFLKQIQTMGKEKSRTKLILLFDLILLLFIFAVVARIVNPLAFTGKKESNQITVSGVQLRVSESRDGERQLPVFFLFMTNSSSVDVKYPSAGMKITAKITTNTGLSCLQEEWQIPSRTIAVGKTEFFRYEPNRDRVNELPEECKVIKPNFWTNITRHFKTAVERNFELEILDQTSVMQLNIEKI